MCNQAQQATDFQLSSYSGYEGGLSLHLNNLIAYQLTNFNQLFGTVSFGFFCQIWM